MSNTKKEEKMAEGESKHDKFKRLASKRVTNAIQKIELIGNLSGSSYECSAEDAEKIITTLQQAVDGVKERFSAKAPEKKKFEL